MITNERQYRVTRAKVKRLESRTKELEEYFATRNDLCPLLVKAQRDAHNSILNELKHELEEYETLKSGKPVNLSFESLDQLAVGLIQTRIASGLTQRELAQRLGLKEQQVQRYEADRYETASYRRLCQVAQALDVRIEQKIWLPQIAEGFEGLLAKLGQIGLSREFVVSRLLSWRDQSHVRGQVPEEFDEERLLERLCASLHRVFGWDKEDLAGSPALAIPQKARSSMRFKQRVDSNDHATYLHAEYVRYLAITSMKEVRWKPPGSMTLDSSQYQSLLSACSNGSLDLQSVLHVIWDWQIIVLPLRGVGRFRSGCYRYNGQNAIVINQNTPNKTRWMFDLFRELHRLTQESGNKTFALVDALVDSHEPTLDQADVAADRFAGNIMLNDRADEFAQVCKEEANGDSSTLKNLVPTVATRANVSVEALANYLANQMKLQGETWWDGASLLRSNGEDPWVIARDVYFERHKVSSELKSTCPLLTCALHY